MTYPIELLNHAVQTYALDESAQKTLMRVLNVPGMQALIENSPLRVDDLIFGKTVIVEYSAKHLVEVLNIKEIMDCIYNGTFTVKDLISCSCAHVADVGHTREILKYLKNPGVQNLLKTGVITIREVIHSWMSSIINLVDLLTMNGVAELINSGICKAQDFLPKTSSGVSYTLSDGYTHQLMLALKHPGIIACINTGRLTVQDLIVDNIVIPNKLLDRLANNPSQVNCIREAVADEEHRSSNRPRM